MNETPGKLSPRQYTRLAGVCYLLIICGGLFGELVVRGSLVVQNDAALTVQNIQASEGLFRAGLAADILMLLCDAALAVLLYILLRPAGAVLALLAMVFRLVQTSLLGSNLLHYFAGLLFASGSAYGSGLSEGETQALALAFLDLHSYGYDLGLFFFGVSNLALGPLLIRSSYFPNILGVGLVLAGVVYLAGSSVRFLAPGLSEAFMPAYIIPLVAEAAVCAWLLVRGVQTGSVPSAED